MGGKKWTLTQSQMAGIVWLSVALVLIAGVLFFSSRKGGRAVENDSITVQKIAELEQKEDSVYRQRRRQKNQQWSASRRHTERRTKQDSVEVWKSAPPTTPPARRQPLRVELNSADTTTLQLLHGIGPAYARRIVKYRERLGGFVSIDQLLEVYGFTPELLEHIRPHLTLETDSLHKIPVNSASLKELIRHPYIEYYQARDLVRLREKGVRFESIDDLRLIPSMADSTLERVGRYVCF